MLMRRLRHETENAYLDQGCARVSNPKTAHASQII